MPHDVEYELCEPFDIDDGQLDGISPQMCFTLGVEWQMFADELDTGREVRRTIHHENVGRFIAMCNRRGRTNYNVRRAEGCEKEWAFITVEAM